MSQRVFVLSAEVGEIGGAAKSTRLLCEALSRIGKRVTLFLTVPPDSSTSQKLRAQNIEVVPSLIRLGCRWGLPSRVNAVRLFFQSIISPPALIHCQGLSAEAKYLLQLPRTAPVYLWENTEALPHVKFVNQTIHRYLHKAAAVLAPSQTIANNVRLTYGYKGKITILPFWVDQPDKNDRASNERSGNLLYLGRFDTDKGIESLCEAFRRVQKLHPSAKLTICGDGDRGLVERLAANNPAIDVRGRVVGQEFEEVISDSDVVVLPSLNEGYPLCLLEACARRKPVISTSVGSVPELFGGRLCALLVRPGDVEELAQAISKILSEDNSIYSARCSDAFDLFSDINSSSIVHRRLIEAYQ